jgi:CRP/FNR family transcriptional regulator, cyclic AMP receptor protein
MIQQANIPDLLRSIPLLKGLNPGEIEEISRQVTVQRVQPGGIFFTEGDLGHGLYVLVKGKVRISKISQAGREVALTEVVPVQAFNAAPAFDDGPCPATATAVTQSEALVLPRLLMLQVTTESRAATEQIIKVVCGRVRLLSDLVADMTHLDVNGRLAKLLLSYWTHDGPGLIGVSQEDLAIIVGTKREVVARALGAMEGADVIERLHGEIAIKSPQALEGWISKANRGANKSHSGPRP